MDRGEIMQMARAAGIENWWDEANADQLSYEAALTRFAALVSAAERAETSIPDEVWRDAMRYRFVRVADKVPISREAARDPAAYDEAIDRAMRERGCEGLPKPKGISRDPTQAVLDVLAERRRQVEVEGWTPEHDDQHSAGQLAGAAACYARHVNARGWVIDTPFDNYTTESPPMEWPWADSWWKPTTPRRDLVKAGALILAEIERLDRMTERQEGK